MNSRREGVAVTVCGQIPLSDLGIVLPHEHLFSDLRRFVEPPIDSVVEKLFREKVTLQNHGYLTRYPYLVLDNAVLDSEKIQTQEIAAFINSGGKTVVDVTTADFGRNPARLKAVSQKTGAHIIMGCGHYLQAAHSEKVARLSIEVLARDMVDELTLGVGNSGIRAGVIGEIGTSEYIHPDEFKALDAACLAQSETGAGMHIHACLWNRNGIIAAQRAIEHGVSPAKICVNHVDVILDLDYIKTLLDMGVFVEFDNFGKEFYVDRRYRALLQVTFASDKERVVALRELVGQGYAGQIFISNDICLKTMTHAFGGWGYDHIISNIIPMMEDYGIGASAVETILRYNHIGFLAMGR